MKRKMEMSMKFSIVVDTIKMLTLQTKIRHCSKKLVKMKSRNPKCLRLKSLSNLTLTMKKAHSSILRGNKRTFQLKVIPKKNKLKRKVHWVMKSKMEISTKCRMVIDMMRRMPLQSKSRQFWKKLIKMKIPSFKCLSLKRPRNPALQLKTCQCSKKLVKIKSRSLKCLRLKSFSNPALPMKKAYSSILRGNKRKLQRKVIPKKHKSMRKVHWVMERKMGISTKCRMVIDMIRRMTLQSKSLQFWKKLIKMKIPSLKCLRLKSPWNPALTPKKVHSGLLRGNTRKLQRKVIPKKNKSMRKVS